MVGSRRWSEERRLRRSEERVRSWRLDAFPEGGRLTKPCVELDRLSLRQMMKVVGEVEGSSDPVGRVEPTLDFESLRSCSGPRKKDEKDQH